MSSQQELLEHKEFKAGKGKGYRDKEEFKCEPLYVSNIRNQEIHSFTVVLIPNRPMEDGGKGGGIDREEGS